MKNSIKDATDRFVDLAFEENPEIKSPSELKSALFRVFDSPRGNNATGQFNDEEIMYFFNSEECRNKIKENVSEEDFDEMYGEIKRGEYEVQREIPKGVPTKSSQVKVIYTKKQISIKTHFRRNKPVVAYNKGYSKWNKAEIRFLKVRKMKKITPKQTLNEYNAHFKKTQRSSSSVKTKFYRV